MSVFAAGLKRIGSELPNWRVRLWGARQQTSLGRTGEDGENWDPVEATATREPWMVWRRACWESLVEATGGSSN